MSKVILMNGRRAGKSMLAGQTFTGMWLDEFVEISKFVIGKKTKRGWYRVQVLPEVYAWVKEYGEGLWHLDYSKEPHYLFNHIMVDPKLLTLLKLKWS